MRQETDGAEGAGVMEVGGLQVQIFHLFSSGRNVFVVRPRLVQGIT